MNFIASPIADGPVVSQPSGCLYGAYSLQVCTVLTTHAGAQPTAQRRSALQNITQRTAQQAARRLQRWRPVVVTGMSKNMFENNSKIPAGVDLLIFPSHSLPRHLSERTRIRVERHQRRLCAPVSAQTRAAKAGAKVAGGREAWLFRSSSMRAYSLVLVLNAECVEVAHGCR